MVIGVLGEIDKRRNDFDSDDRTPYDAFATLPESFTNIAIKMLIDNSKYEIIFLIKINSHKRKKIYTKNMMSQVASIMKLYVL